MVDHEHGSRLSKAGWSRLKSVTIDPLESIGLLSKGDNRYATGVTQLTETPLTVGSLLDYEAQESYHNTIVERYAKLYNVSCNSEPLDTSFAALSLDTNNKKYPEPAGNVAGSLHNAARQSMVSSKDISDIILAMRKLREAIVASARTDTFALEAYIFIIRTTVLAGHVESYHPALLHLLRRIHHESPLPEILLQQILGFYILDLACRQNDLGTAYQVMFTWQYKDPKVEAILKALVHGDWCAYWTLGKSMDTYQKRLLEWSKDRMRKHALNCLGQSYLSVDKSYIASVVQQSWEEVVEKDNRQWQLYKNTVTIRRIKRE